VEGLQDVEHRAVILVEKPRRDAHLVLRVYSYEVLVEGSMMDGAEAESVADRRIAVLLSVADDVRGIQEAGLPQTADRTPIAVCRHDPRAEPCLMNADSGLAKHVPPLESVLHDDGLELV